MNITSQSFSFKVYRIDTTGFSVKGEVMFLKSQSFSFKVYRIDSGWVMDTIALRALIKFVSILFIQGI